MHRFQGGPVGDCRPILATDPAETCFSAGFFVACFPWRAGRPTSGDVSEEQLFDIAVIGGGVNGCGIARDAAGRGARVLLLEQGDLAQGTSSASTKLIHGGLRYLEHREFALVREALSDGWVDDARLVVLNARDAADRGARIETRAALTAGRDRASSA